MAPSKPFPSACRIIEERFEQKSLDIHRRNLDAIKSMVDTSEPKYMHHLERNAKKAEREAERQFEIEAENARLYQRLAAVVDFDSTRLLRASPVRTSLTAKPGMFYSGGRQCLDHINLTAMSNPRSTHYRGPSVNATTTQSRPISRATSRRHLDLDLDSSGLSSGAEDGGPSSAEKGGTAQDPRVLRTSSGSSADTDTLLAPRSASVMLAGLLGGRVRAPHPPNQPHPNGVGSAYLAPPVAPHPPKTAALGPQQWSVQLVRSRQTSEADGTPFGLSSVVGKPPHGSPFQRQGVSLELGGFEEALRSPDRLSHEHQGGGGEGLDLLCFQLSRLESRASGNTGPRISGSRPSEASSLGRSTSATPSSDAAVLAPPAHTSTSARSSHHGPVRHASLLGYGGTKAGGSAAGSPSGTPRKPAPPRGSSPLKAHAVSKPQRCSSPASSRGASPRRPRSLSMLSAEFEPSTASSAFVPGHGLRKEVLKSTYLGGANVQVKGNTIMATRRSAVDLSTLAHVHAQGSLSTRSSRRYSGNSSNIANEDSDEI